MSIEALNSASPALKTAGPDGPAKDVLETAIANHRAEHAGATTTPAAGATTETRGNAVNTVA